MRSFGNVPHNYYYNETRDETSTRSQIALPLTPLFGEGVGVRGTGGRGWGLAEEAVSFIFPLNPPLG